MIALSQQAALESVALKYRQAKAEFHMLDQLSRTRALNWAPAYAGERVALGSHHELGAASFLDPSTGSEQASLETNGAGEYRDAS